MVKTDRRTVNRRRRGRHVLQGAPVETIGLLGGMSSSSTADYYRRINALVNEEVDGTSAADIVLHSVDRAVIDDLVGRVNGR
jgi:aspartate/glutamate racemase